MELPSPDVDIRRLARVHQSVALNRRFYSFLAKLQPFWFTPATGYLPEPTSIREPTRLGENNVAPVGRPGKTPSELNTRDEVFFFSSRNRYGVDCRDSL